MNKPKVSILTVTFDQDLHWLKDNNINYNVDTKANHITVSSK